MQHLPRPVLDPTDARRPKSPAPPEEAAATLGGLADATVLMLALAEVQYDRRGRLPARLPTTRLPVIERALRAELLRRGLTVTSRPSVAPAPVTMRMA